MNVSADNTSGNDAMKPSENAQKRTRYDELHDSAMRKFVRASVLSALRQGTKPSDSLKEFVEAVRESSRVWELAGEIKLEEVFDGFANGGEQADRAAAKIRVKARNGDRNGSDAKRRVRANSSVGRHVAAKQRSAQKKSSMAPPLSARKGAIRGNRRFKAWADTVESWPALAKLVGISYPTALRLRGGTVPRGPVRKKIAKASKNAVPVSSWDQ